MKNKILTAEELITKIDEDFYKKHSYYQSQNEPESFAKTVAIAFTKLHLEAQREAIKENVVLEYDSFPNGNPIGIDKQSIDDVYPLNNVK